MEVGVSAAGKDIRHWDRAAEVDAALAHVFRAGVRPLQVEEALLDAILAG
jgi:hypothetical protein